MNLGELRRDEDNIFYIIIIFCFILILAYLLAKVLSPVWGSYTGVFHSGLEFTCVAIALLTFMIVWYTYNVTPSAIHILAFGYLAVAIFDIFHTVYFPALYLYPEGYFDLSTRYWMLGRLTEGITLFAFTLFLYNSNFKINRWLGLVTATFIPIFLCLIILFFPSIMPVLLTETGVTTPKMIMEYIVITLYILALFHLIKLRNKQDFVAYRYVAIVVLIGVPAELCFIIFDSITSFYNTLGHFLKISSYYFLIHGVIISGITYPYKQLELAGDYLKSLLNNLSVGLITFNNDFTLGFANDKALEILECSEDDIKGQHAVTVSEYFRIDKTSVEKRMNQLVKTTIPIEHEINYMTTPNGEKKLLKISAQRMINGGYIYTFMEALKEQEIQNLQLQTRTILDSIHNLAIIYNNKKRITMINKSLEINAELIAKEVIGKTLPELGNMLKLKGLNNLESIYNSQFNEIVEVSITSLKSNFKRNLIINASPIKNIKGEEIGGIIVASDITELKKQQQNSLHKEKLALIGQMTAGFVHEIKNPLTTIKGFSQFLSLNSTDEEVKEFAKMIETTADEVNKVVNDFLQFSKATIFNLTTCSTKFYSGIYDDYFRKSLIYPRY